MINRRLYLLAILILVTCSCSREPSTLTLRGETMGSVYQVVIVDLPDHIDAKSIEPTVVQVLTNINALFSNWDPESEVSLFNRQATTQPVAISAAFSTLLDAADEVHTASLGRFDLTTAPLIELWGFGGSGSRQRKPDQAEILAALDAVGQRELLRHDRNAQTLQKHKAEATVFVAAIAKGAGIDAVAEQLEALGIDNYLVEIGGDLRVAGVGRHGRGWRIGVERPTPGLGDVQEALWFVDGAMATSGDYRNYFEADGIRYSHILDPTTGAPVTHRTASVTVVAETATLADAWATALLVLGREQGLAIAENEGLAAMFLERPENPEATRIARYATERFADLQSGALE